MLPAEITLSSVECRTLGHQWDEINPPEPRKGSKAVGHFLWSMRCERCSKERHESWHRKTGELITRSYTKPEGYHAIPRDYRAPDLRLELLRRWK